VEARNSADGLIYATEKSINELGDRVDSATRGEVEKVIDDLKQSMEGDDTAEIKRLTELLTHASHRLSETIYQQNAQAGSCQSGCGTGNEFEQAYTGPNDDVVDAEFREVA